MPKESALKYIWGGDKCNTLIGLVLLCENATDPQPTPAEVELVRIFSEHKQLQAKNKQMEYDLAIVHEHTNLADSNTKETFVDANRMIRNRTRQYENLRLTAGPLYREGQEDED